MTARLAVVPPETPPLATTPPATVSRLLTVEQAAAVWQVSPRFVRDLIKRGAVPAIRLGRAVRVARETVEKIAREGLS